MSEFPENKTMMKVIFRLAKSGEVRTEALVTIPVEDYVSISEQLPD